MAARRSRGQPARARRVAVPAQDPDPYQQHQSRPARGLARARGTGARRRRGRVRRAGDRAMTGPSEARGDAPPLPEAAFLARLRDEGARRYHDEHPFHRRMHEGTLARADLQRWVANRYYYQTRIPIKDALILSKSDDSGFRRMWIQRIHDHDGTDREEGGLVRWQRLGDAVGLDRAELIACKNVLPGVRFACDAYVHFVRDASLVEAVASSLTEFFAPDLMVKRI